MNQSQEFRVEHDTMGEVKVPANVYWGAQTQRSLQNFKIGNQRMPIEIIRAFAVLKKAAAITNNKLGTLSLTKCDLICSVCDEILEGMHDEQFPLVIWQTGSGTQSNMNVNEVIANRAHVLNGGKLSDENKVLHGFSVGHRATVIGFHTSGLHTGSRSCSPNFGTGNSLGKSACR